MTETMKDYQRIEHFQWELKARRCPCYNHNNAVCFLVGKTCEFQVCPFQYWVGQS